jgi:hypothetical protein
MPGTEKSLETGLLSLADKVTVCLFFHLFFLKLALIGLPDISRVIGRTIIEIMK